MSARKVGLNETDAKRGVPTDTLNGSFFIYGHTQCVRTYILGVLWIVINGFFKRNVRFQSN